MRQRTWKQMTWPVYDFMHILIVTIEVAKCNPFQNDNAISCVSQISYSSHEIPAKNYAGTNLANVSLNTVKPLMFICP
jgi:hypothetical protein